MQLINLGLNAQHTLAAYSAYVTLRDNRSYDWRYVNAAFRAAQKDLEFIAIENKISYDVLYDACQAQDTYNYVNNKSMHSIVEDLKIA